MLWDLLVQLGVIAYTVVLPLLLMIGIGYVVQRALGLEMATLTRLNFYLVVPGMVYFVLVDSDVAWGDIGTVVGFSLLAMIVWTGMTLLVARLRGVERDQRRAMLMSVIFYNAGNYGLPLQELAFRPVGRSELAMGLQVFVMLVQNLTSFTIGILLAAGRSGDGMWKRNLVQILKFPPIYAVAAAGLTIAVRHLLGDRSDDVANALEPFWDTVLYVKDGFVVIALATLGAQLANVTRGQVYYPVTTTVVLRLLAAPLVGFVLIWLMGIEGLTAQVLLISTATPTSVNCLLLCLQFKNHPDYVARSVFYSTVLSPVTVTLVILLARGGVV
ncbi:AEC family transporter [Phycisphaerales bacterium AB-hyl4]|uniref:AEC family transporter n=1 Tax=Natronomicrosphaera hydrolytica TaxID=3242702 RepID=A0ABV4U9C6_9BACT